MSAPCSPWAKASPGRIVVALQLLHRGCRPPSRGRTRRSPRGSGDLMAALGLRTAYGGLDRPQHGAGEHRRRSRSPSQGSAPLAQACSPTRSRSAADRRCPSRRSGSPCRTSYQVPLPALRFGGFPAPVCPAKRRRRAMFPAAARQRTPSLTTFGRSLPGKQFPTPIGVTGHERRRGFSTSAADAIWLTIQLCAPGADRGAVWSGSGSACLQALTQIQGKRRWVLRAQGSWRFSSRCWSSCPLMGALLTGFMHHIAERISSL